MFSILPTPRPKKQRLEFLCRPLEKAAPNHFSALVYCTAEANDAVVSLSNVFWTWRQTEAPEYAYKFGVSPPVEGVVEEFTEAAFQRRKVSP